MERLRPYVLGVVVAVAVFAAIHVLNAQVAPWATGKIERGEEFSLPEQVLVTVSYFTARWGVILAAAAAAITSLVCAALAHRRSASGTR